MATVKEDKQLVEYKRTVTTALTEAQQMEVADFEGVMDAADFLLKVKSVGDQITARKEQITKPLNEGLKSTRSLFREAEEAYASVERIVKDKILDWHQRRWDAGKVTDNRISGMHGNVTVVERM